MPSNHPLQAFYTLDILIFFDMICIVFIVKVENSNTITDAKKKNFLYLVVQA
jgi:hypothetical protein